MLSIRLTELWNQIEALGWNFNGFNNHLHGTASPLWISWKQLHCIICIGWIIFWIQELFPSLLIAKKLLWLCLLSSWTWEAWENVINHFKIGHMLWSEIQKRRIIVRSFQEGKQVYMYIRHYNTVITIDISAVKICPSIWSSLHHAPRHADIQTSILYYCTRS